MKIGDKVMVMATPVNYAKDRVGIYKGKYQGGFAVQLEEHVCIWAEKIKKVKEIDS